MIEDASEARVSIAAEARLQFQVAPAGRVHLERVRVPFGDDAAHVGQGALLRVAHILKEAAGSTDTVRKVGDAEALQILRTELGAEQTGGGFRVEVPGRHQVAREAAVIAAVGRGENEAVFHQQLRHTKPGQLGVQIGDRGQFGEAEAAGGEIEPGQAEGVRPLADGRDKIVPACVEEGIVGERAGRDHAHHLALDGTPGRRRIADLLAQRHGFAGPHEAGEVLLGRVIGHAGHRDTLAGGLAAGSQRDAEQR